MHYPKNQETDGRLQSSLATLIKSTNKLGKSVVFVTSQFEKVIIR